MLELEQRMKDYEAIYDIHLKHKNPVIIRVDGKHFHELTRDMEKPFCENIRNAMIYAGKKTATEMTGFVLGYHQSDEFTFFLQDYMVDNLNPWFNYRIQKIISTAASLFTKHFNDFLPVNASFDARCFNISDIDVANMFLWRQKDNTRNSISAFARTWFSHDEIQNKKSSDLLQMTSSIGHDWHMLSNQFKFGTFITDQMLEISKSLSYLDINTLITMYYERHYIITNNH